MELLAEEGYSAGREELLRGQLLDDLEPVGYSDPVLQQQLEARLQIIVQHINTKRKPGGRIAGMRWIRVAAAAVLAVLLGSGAWYWFTRPAFSPGTPVAAQHPQNDVSPGGNRAVLTLANGQQLLLDSAANGLLAQQGSTTVQKKDGQLIYEAPHAPLTTNHALVFNTMTTPRGGQYRLTLPDGTNVWLNAASSIRYPTAFTGRERNVFITGEAYFEVQQNAAKPFTVNVNNRQTIEVLGTHFNINAYDDEPSVNTTLLEGSVRLRPLSTVNGQPSTVLSPGQQAQLINTHEPVRVISKADIEQVMAWKNNLFRFDSADLKKVMRQLARWYNVDVEYEKAAPVNEQFFGEMQRNLNLSQVLNGLAGMGVHFRIEGRKLVVMP